MIRVEAHAVIKLTLDDIRAVNYNFMSLKEQEKMILENLRNAVIKVESSFSKDVSIEVCEKCDAKIYEDQEYFFIPANDEVPSEKFCSLECMLDFAKTKYERGVVGR